MRQTTTIETTDYIHSTGVPMVSLKTITTELPQGWGEGFSPAECDAMLARIHAAAVEIEQYRGLIAEGKGSQQALDYALLRLEDAEPEAYLEISDEIAAHGIESL